MAMILSAMRSAWLKIPLYASPEECAGKTYIVTGSNIGVGLEVARNLVAQKPKRVIMAVRSPERGRLAREDIEASTGVTGVAEVWQLDLSSYDSVRAFAERVEKLDRVDGVLQNAVAANGEWTEAEGWESAITVNIFGTLLLGVLLMPYLKRCGERYGMMPAMSFVGSGMAFLAEGDLERLDQDHIFEDWNNPDKFPMNMGRYSLSKLLLLFAVRRLAQLAPPEKSGVILNVSDPGPSRNTGLVRYANLMTKIQVNVLYMFISRSAEMGSRALIHAITAGKEAHGKFVENNSIDEAGVPAFITNANGDKWAECVWAQVAAELEKIEPGSVQKALS